MATCHVFTCGYVTSASSFYVHRFMNLQPKLLLLVTSTSFLIHELSSYLLHDTHIPHSLFELATKTVKTVPVFFSHGTVKTVPLFCGYGTVNFLVSFFYAHKRPRPFAIHTPQKPCKLAGRSSPYCGDMWRRYCCLTSFFPIVDTCLSCEDIAWQSCGMVPRWRFFVSFLRPVFSASQRQHISDLHSKFALRSHHVWKYGRHPISDGWD